MTIFGLFGSRPLSQIAQASNRGLSRGAGVPLGISGVENESFVCN